MKLTSECPKCGSTHVLADVKVNDFTEDLLVKEMSVTTYKHPEALIFRGRATSTLSAWVCGDCGYLELYADNPQALSDSYGQYKK